MNILEGVVISNKVKETLLVEVVRRTPHASYKKLIKKAKTYKVDSSGISANIGDSVRIGETRPISKDKHFKLLEVLGKKEDKK